jgi:AraC-like DNA-binding protein
MVEKRSRKLPSKTGFSKKKMGPPKIEIDVQQVEALAALQCTMEEIASGVGVSRRTLQDRCAEDEAFRTAIEKGREMGTRSLRRLQYEAAKTGNVTMQIWLGKQWLGQADKSETHVSAEITKGRIFIMPEGDAEEAAADTTA